MFEDDNDVLVHAGIHPSWSLDDARDRARELETVLRSDDYEGFLERWRTDAPPANTEEVRMHDSLDVFTRMRVINRQTSDLDFRFKGALGEVPGDLEPWFRRRNHMTETHRIFFGHWAALGYHEENNTVATDSGCVWGRYLTGFRRSDGVVVSQPAIDKLPRQSF
jgi:bis(5'-nucleosyl)-tetraphosphatase (symmetrical)